MYATQSGPNRIADRTVGPAVAAPESLDGLSTRLVEVFYSPVLDFDPVRVIAQTVGHGDAAFAWIDGLDEVDPILVPLSAMKGTREFGTVAAYFDANAEMVAAVLEINVKAGAGGEGGVGASASMIVRSVEVMKEERCDAMLAVYTATTWANFFLELDQIERMVFNEAFAAAARAISEAELASVLAAELAVLEAR